MPSIGSHHSARAATEEWLTPPAIIAALGPFDLDPCAPVNRPWPMAARHFTIIDNGLAQLWTGRVWLNPPYSASVIGRWLARMAAHNHGTALIFARTETQPFFRYVWEACTALLFLEGRLHFHYPDGTRAKPNGGAPSVLCAYGRKDADRLADSGLAGQFVPLLIPTSLLIPRPAGDAAPGAATWRQLVRAILASEGKPIPLAELYRLISGHPLTERNRNWRAKVRQTLQRGAGRRAAPGIWQLELTL
ncbi:DNA N-6-adenine-methyltransferase [Oceanibaculum indicum]|uniref:Adenine methyltransferase n=1 Tax=Oceanibaculum indicum P24 TaxID=1207063 RepID=K2IL57_9PROT|nr:DNA N-6-adenine-methyltransferase [Oceanibaculum indicum]EKE70866.1 hypothetical protein P24_15024 [Oceanibaculum indicum P24]